MAKRGERRPWRVTFEWSSGVKGVDTFISQDEAEMRAEKIRKAAEWRDDATVTVTVAHRDETPTPAPLAVECPFCGQPPGRQCSRGLYVYVPISRPHVQRYAAARESAGGS